MKKVVLSLSILFTMCIALVIGCVGNSSSKSSKVLGDNNTSDTHVVTDIVEKPTTYTYQPGEVMVKKGGNTISFNYSPSVNATEDTPTTVAYEYCFGNSMNRATAVNLKEIDTTDVTVSYAWSLNTKLDTTQSITTYTNYELQKLNNHGDKVYIYVFVTPTNTSIPTTFTSSIVWYYGIPYDMPIFNNVTNTVEYQTVVSGQKIDKNTLDVPEAPREYAEFMGWFLDANYTIRVEDEDLKTGRKIYAQFSNLPTDWLTLDEESDTYHITKPASNPSTLPSNLVIPSKYNGKPVTEIATSTTAVNGIFANQTTLTSVTLPSTITVIGNYAFYQCSGLTSITIPSSVTSIGGNAFYSCKTLAEVYNLSSLDIVAGATTHGYVGYNAGIVVNGPRDESKLVTIDGVDYYKNSETDYMVLRLSDKTKTSITLDSRTTSIINYAFYQCINLTNVDLSKCNNLTTIGNYAFSNCDSLTSITLPSSVTTIGNYAFYRSSLTSITIPSSVTSIGGNAFYSCKTLAEVYNLSSLDIVAGATTHGYVGYNAGIVVNGPRDESKLVTIDGVDYYKNSETDYMVLRLSDKTKTSITLDSRTTSIINYAFYQCINLTNVDLSKCNNLTTIGNDAFSGCSSLISIAVPSGLTSVAGGAFSSCKTLAEVYISDIEAWCNISFMNGSASNPLNNGASLYLNNQLVKDLTIPSTVTEIKQYTFTGSSLMSVTIPSSVTTIGTSAFASCYALSEVYNLSSLDIVAGASTYGDIARYATIVVNGPRDESKFVTIDGVEYYKNSETDYIALRLSDKTKTSITLDSRTTQIGRYAFYGCTSLTSVNLSGCSNLTTIGDCAFCNCSSLTSITIPSSVTSIGGNAFYSCKTLAEVYNLSSLNIVAGANTHGYVSVYAGIVVNGPRDESKLVTIDGVDYYKNSETDYMALRLSDKTKTSITLDSRTTSIRNYAFYECASLTNVDLSKCTNLTTIGYYAFYSSSLTSITIPSSVTKIGQYAFRNSGLTSLTIQGWDSGTWYKTNNSTNWNNMTNGTEFTGSFADASQNATWFKSNSSYYNYYWYKK